jgi:hypothetical protein
MTFRVRQPGCRFLFLGSKARTLSQGVRESRALNYEIFETV